MIFFKQGIFDRIFFFSGQLIHCKIFQKKNNYNQHFFGGEIWSLGSKKRLAVNHTKVFFQKV
jgi:hypothetical protein